MSYEDDLVEVLRQTDADCKTIIEALGLDPYGNSRLHRICERLIECLEGAVHVAPFAKGDRVRLLKQPVISDEISPGWRFAKGFLVENALAEVRAVKFDSRGFGLLLAFDNDGGATKALFYFKADQVEKA